MKIFLSEILSINRFDSHYIVLEVLMKTNMRRGTMVISETDIISVTSSVAYLFSY